jgi:hypothetical protein
VHAKLKTLNVENDTVDFKAQFLSLIKAIRSILKFLHLFNCKYINNSVIIAIANNCKLLATFSMPCKSGPNKAVTEPAMIWLDPLHYAIEGIVTTQFKGDHSIVSVVGSTEVTTAQTFVAEFYPDWRYDTTCRTETGGHYTHR